MKVWFNLYRDGFYHRRGKPGVLKAHPGDLYESFLAAWHDIDRDAPYIGTFSADIPLAKWTGTFEDWQETLKPYPADSVPQNLRQTRPAFARTVSPSHIEGLRPLTAFEQRAEVAEAALQDDDGLTSLETSEADAVEVAPPWHGARLNEALGLEPLPGEGYNPGERRPTEPVPLQCLPPAGVAAISRFFSAQDAKLFRPLHAGYPGRVDEGSAV